MDIKTHCTSHRSIVVLLWVLASLAPSWLSWAQDEPSGKHLSEGHLSEGHLSEGHLIQESQLMMVGGEQGVWFPMAKAKLLLTDLSTLKEQQKLNQKLEARLELEISRVGMFEGANNNCKAREQLWQKTAKELSEKVAQNEKWYKSPTLWAVVGAVLGVGTTILIFHAK